MNLLKKIWTWLTRKTPKKQDPIVQLTDIKDPEIANKIIWQSVWLQDDEVLVYKDPQGNVHYFTNKPIDPEKEYKILYIE